MTIPQIGLSIEIDAPAIKRSLVVRFPALEILTMEEAVASGREAWPPIVFTAAAKAGEFPTLVDFLVFPGESGTEVAIGLALARLFSKSLGCRTVSDGSGLGDDISPYWSIIHDGEHTFLADDCSSAFVDDEGGSLRIVREISPKVCEFDERAILVDFAANHDVKN
jgi:hypothetical protein